MAIILPNEKLVLNAYAVLVGETPGNAALQEHLAYIAANGSTAYVSVLNSIFAEQSTASLASAMLANLGLSSIFTQAEAEAFLAGNAANRVGAMINLSNALYNYAGTDAAIVAAHDAYVNAIAGSYNYSIDPTHVVGADLSGNIVSGGQTLTLTAGADNIAGTSGNDTINALTIDSTGAAATTLSAFDSIDGGAGIDTLNIYSDGVKNTSLPTSATVSNVEIININNDTAAFSTNGAGNIDAAKFAGATNINQVGLASTTMTNLAAATTATFTDLAAATIDVEAASAATSITVALADVDDASSVALRSTATGLTNAFTISGTVVDAAANGVGSINVSIEGGKDVTTLTLNTAVASTLTVVNNGTAVSTVNAAASTGDITYVAANTVANITTGTGEDDVDLQFQATATSKAATVSTGAGDDILSILVNANGQTGVTVTADAGAGDDVVDINNSGTVAVNFTAGAGNDEVTLADGLSSVATTDVINGGEGTDKVVLNAVNTTLDAEDYIILRDVITGFEAIEFNTTAVTADASRMSAYKDIAFDGVNGTLTKVANDQAISAYEGDLDLTAAGYDSTTTPVTYAGALNVTYEGNISSDTVTAKAESISLTVKQDSLNDGASDNVTATLLGDVKSATVTLVADVDNNTTATDTSDDYLDTATVVVNNSATLAKLASLTLTGNGIATITNADGKSLVTVNAADLNSADIDGVATAGLTYTTTNTKAETITLGGGLDTVTLTASTVLKSDTITGLHLVDDAAVAGTQVDTAKSDSLVVKSNDGSVSLGSFVKTTTTAATLDLALVDLASSAAGDKLVFQFGGNTYIYADVAADGTAGDGIVNDTDVLVKLTGTIDLDLLVSALG